MIGIDGRRLKHSRTKRSTRRRSGVLFVFDVLYKKGVLHSVQCSSNWRKQEWRHLDEGWSTKRTGFTYFPCTKETNYESERPTFRWLDHMWNLFGRTWGSQRGQETKRAMWLRLHFKQKKKRNLFRKHIITSYYFIKTSGKFIWLFVALSSLSTPAGVRQK